MKCPAGYMLISAGGQYEDCDECAINIGGCDPFEYLNSLNAPRDIASLAKIHAESKSWVLYIHGVEADCYKAMRRSLRDKHVKNSTFTVIRSQTEDDLLGKTHSKQS